MTLIRSHTCQLKVNSWCCDKTPTHLVILHILVIGLKYKCQFFLMFTHNWYFMYVQIHNYQSYIIHMFCLQKRHLQFYIYKHSLQWTMNEYSCSVALGCNNMTICDILSPPRISAYRWSAHSIGAYIESREQETTGTIQTQPLPPQYGSCPKDYLYKVFMIFSSETRLQCMKVWTSAEMWHNLIKSKLSKY